jgi:hypothetical protein
MEPERYTALVSELEQAARTNPRMLRWRMFMMIAVSAMTISRESRGLPVREGAAELAQDPFVSLLMLVATLAVYGFLVVVLVRNGSYFTTASPEHPA